VRCYYVQVRGVLSWQAEQLNDEDSFTPAGFTCHRYVLAAGYEDAAQKAFKRVRHNLEKRTGWIGSGNASLSLEAEELTPAPMYKLLRRDDRGHIFYEDDVAANDRVS
jgi:hypothetical protein